MCIKDLENNSNIFHGNKTNCLRQSKSCANYWVLCSAFQSVSSPTTTTSCRLDGVLIWLIKYSDFSGSNLAQAIIRPTSIVKYFWLDLMKYFQSWWKHYFQLFWSPSPRVSEEEADDSKDVVDDRNQVRKYFLIMKIFRLLNPKIVLSLSIYLDDYISVIELETFLLLRMFLLSRIFLLLNRKSLWY